MDKIVGEAQKSLLLADRMWHEEGCPSDAAALGAVLEKILRPCLASQIWCAPVLLQRRKALERGTWRLRTAMHRGNSTIPSAEASDGVTQSPSGSCTNCAGTRIVIHKDGFSGSMCSCGALLRRLQRGR